MTQRKECDKCQKPTRIGILILHKPTGEKRCSRCIRKYGQNRFYEPKINGAIQKRKFIKMTLTQDEKRELWDSYTKLGLSEEQIRQKIRYTQNHLFLMQRRRMFLAPKKIELEEPNKKFLEGLKQ